MACSGEKSSEIMLIILELCCLMRNEMITWFHILKIYIENVTSDLSALYLTRARLHADHMNRKRSISGTVQGLNGTQE